ncbi:carboxypeptidase-like regulatory domain-containing protein [Paenibacillus sp. HWE-109]|uniref:beta-sandwich domain-containing protein n=1 Tax=Paenibacillus sp. HWE-109 TaxID=1306526 RepID=UPI001EDDDE84|nr:DUF2012 domain-containing protein [Paenibacillus sp. HWE-109]UKS25289.1 carboxypeptidase-like regulatory domain-containing protein [Paenibacillus sp. HWE-109]
MEHIRVSQLKTRVSLVVCVIDASTSKTPLGNTTTVYLEGTRSKAISKSNGSYIFNDLPPGDYRLTVSSEYYFPEQSLITVGTDNFIEIVQLKPLPSYPFSQGAGLIRAMLKDAAGAPIMDAKLQARIVTEECARARIMMDQADKGALEVTLGSFTGTIAAGDAYILRGRGAKPAEEHIRIVEVLEYQKRFRLERKLTKAYTRGSLLLPVQETRSTERGEAVIAFRGNRIQAFQTELIITYGKDRSELTKEVLVSEGMTTNLGVIRLT